ncbi:MAG: DUF3656 domain-containing protein [Atopobiaceae bacterium]|nr:DUF3656 domain-containing protein [Atopobiaceae bacterium]
MGPLDVVVGSPHVRDSRMPELLAPAGGPEPFRAALAAGADAIYCGLGSDFNARRGARNFDEGSFSEACREAHLAGARVYVTENVVIRTSEMPRALALVRRATELGADAFIIQDWGLLAEVRRLWPQVEVHVSTQANVHDARGVAWCRDEFGAHRVTLSRELSLPEIELCSREGVELEVFGHGALCFCYSGVCLYSSFFGGRSANRGLCAQPCRLPHELVDEHGETICAPGRDRPLCPKDACTIDDLAELVGAGAGALKVEGRMKAPEYVLSVASSYRLALDALARGRRMPKGEDADLHRVLKRAFNRDFTDAYLRGTSGDEMMSYGRSNNRGETVGRVVASHSDGRRAVADIALEAPVGKGDLLELRHPTDPDDFITCLAPDDAEAGETIGAPCPRRMPAGSVVRALRSQHALDVAGRASSCEIPRRREVDVSVKALLGEPLQVTLSTTDGLFSASATGAVVERARTKAVSREDLVEHVGRMGQTPFAPRDFSVEMDDGTGMAFSAVHKVRSDAADSLAEAILEPNTLLASTLAEVPMPDELLGTGEGKAAGRDVEVCALVSSPEAAAAAFSAGATRLYATADDLGEGEWPEGVVPVLDEVCRAADHGRLDRLVEEGAPVAVGNVSELALATADGARPEIRGCIPIHNTSALAALEARGAAGVWLSCELTLEEISELAPHASVPVGLVVSGRPRLMTSEHCVLQAAGACIHDCSHCQLRARRLSLRNIDGKMLPVRTDVHGRSRIYDAHPLDATSQVPQLVSAGVSRLAVDGTLLGPEEVEAAVARVVRAVTAARDGRKPAPRAQGATSGHLFMGIG